MHGLLTSVTNEQRRLVNYHLQHLSGTLIHHRASSSTAASKWRWNMRTCRQITPRSAWPSTSKGGVPRPRTPRRWTARLCSTWRETHEVLEAPLWEPRVEVLVVTGSFWRGRKLFDDSLLRVVTAFMQQNSDKSLTAWLSVPGARVSWRLCCAVHTPPACSGSSCDAVHRAEQLAPHPCEVAGAVPRPLRRNFGCHVAESEDLRRCKDDDVITGPLTAVVVDVDIFDQVISNMDPPEKVVSQHSTAVQSLLGRKLFGGLFFL